MYFLGSERTLVWLRHGNSKIETKRSQRERKMGIGEAGELAQECDEKGPWDDSCAAASENDRSKLVRESRGPLERVFSKKGSSITHTV